MGDLPITGFDIVVCAIVLISALLAYARGFVHEVLSLLGWVGAAFLTLYGFPFIKPYARDLLPNMPMLADLAGGAVLFIISLMALSILSKAIAGRIRESALNALDRALGFLFGLARGALIVCLAYIGVESLIARAEQPDWMRSARTMPAVEAGAAWLRALVPSETSKSLGVPMPTSPSTADSATREPDAGQILRDMMSPKPKAAEKPAKDGYGTNQRRELDRLIDAAK